MRRDASLRPRLRYAPGLRARLVAALVATSALTLAVAAVGLLGPLETRLRHQELKSLTATAVAAIPAFDDATEPLANAPDALASARSLERRSGARVAIFDSRGTPVIDTRPEEPFGPVPRTRTRSPAAGRVRARSSSSAAVAVAAVRFRHGGQLYTLALRKPLDDVTAAADDVEHAFTEAALAGLGVAVLLGLGFSAYLVRRIRRLRDATVRVGAAGGGDAGLPIDTSHDEVGDLARAFRRMQVRLQHQEEARRQFVATASHELRTPLASLQGMLELLEHDLRASPPDLADALDQVARAEAQSRRLATLAADLLDLTRLDADVELRSEPVELGELCRAVAAEFELRVSGRGGPPIELDGASCWAVADPGSVARVVRILLDNACRFSPPDRAIRIATRELAGRAEVTVEDEGDGVPEEEREVIFERFRRGSATADEGGFGLGLAIGRGLARRMDGDLTLEPGERGARFTLRLPGAVEAAVPAAHAHH